MSNTDVFLFFFYIETAKQNYYTPYTYYLSWREWKYKKFYGVRSFTNIKRNPVQKKKIYENMLQSTQNKKISAYAIGFKINFTPQIGLFYIAFD